MKKNKIIHYITCALCGQKVVVPENNEGKVICPSCDYIMHIPKDKGKIEDDNDD